MITASSWCKSTRCKGCSGQIVALRSRIIGRIERIMGSLKRIIGKDLEINFFIVLKALYLLSHGKGGQTLHHFQT